MRPRMKLYLDGPGGGTFGEGVCRLLEAIAAEGSIREAARLLGRGYRKAWGDIDRAEEAFGRRLVSKSRGGSSGGATELTPFGRELVAAWERFSGEAAAGMEEAFERHLGAIIEGGNRDER
ncbi:MAG: LysR family transcriptional regulator [Candidatus Krumholzibacteria bacterium]|nr:LysR family transcriptional regulator [Candidatus Krumholzibacteria bacterium]